MQNRALADAFDELANLMELHDEDGFRIRSYRNAYLTLRKVEQPLSELSEGELKSIKGIGPAIAAKIVELNRSGKMATLEKYRAMTPPGVVEMLNINGFGPKKVQVVWRDLGVESAGELWYACNENRLLELKGFGQKTQEALKVQLAYYLKSRNRMHLDAADEEADFACTWLSGRLPGCRVSPVGEVRRRMPVVDTLEILCALDGSIEPALEAPHFQLETSATPGIFQIRLENGTPLTLYTCPPAAFAARLFELTGSAEFQNAFFQQVPALKTLQPDQESAFFEHAALPFVVPELRESAGIVETARLGQLPDLITAADLLGVLHVHTTYSDGLHSLRDMCTYARDLGYAYIGITDHSQTAVYANGLKTDRLLQQWAEIDALNTELAPFRIFKGIESDILSDGSLDYPDDLLARFDFVIASVHAFLNMSREKATERIVRAVENPHTTILGHPTGRLLLSRTGYPLDWDAVFDACARHQVAIELNANPYRLDLDYTLIPHARKMGILIAVNPDAHSKDGIHDLRYGIDAARKGGLTKEGCVNVLNAEQFSMI